MRRYLPTLQAPLAMALLLLATLPAGCLPFTLCERASGMTAAQHREAARTLAARADALQKLFDPSAQLPPPAPRPATPLAKKDGLQAPGWASPSRRQHPANPTHRFLVMARDLRQLARQHRKAAERVEEEESPWCTDAADDNMLSLDDVLP